MVQAKQEVIPTKEFLTRVGTLADYVKRAAERGRASILLALFKAESTRRLAERALTGILEGQGFRIVRVALKENENSDLVRLLLNLQQSPDDIFYIYRLRAEGQSALNSLNIRRELLVENAIKVVFWLEESELQWLAFGAPDFWAFRHRVVEFLEPPEEETFQQADQRLLEDATYASHEELLAKIRVRQDLLKGIPKEAAYERARMHFDLGTLLYENGDYTPAKKHLEQALGSFKRLKHDQNRANTLHQLGMIAQDQGDYEEALALIRQAEAIFAKLGSPELAKASRVREGIEQALAQQKALRSQ